MGTVFEPAVRGFPPVPEIAWVDDAYVAPPTFTDDEPDDNQPIVLEATSHVVVVPEVGLDPTEEPSVATVPPVGDVPDPLIPAITAIDPATGDAAGGTDVVITGTELHEVTDVKFDTTAAASFTVDSPTQITATSPAHGAGAVDITLTNAAGTSAAVAADSFTYT